MAGEDELQTVIARLDRALASAGTIVPRAERPAPAVSADLIDRWRKLCETSALLNSMRNDFETVLETVLDTAIELTHARRGLVFLKNEDGGLDIRLGRDHRRSPLPEPHDYPRSIVDRAVQKAEPIFLPTITERQAGLGASVRNLGAAILPPNVQVDFFRVETDGSETPLGTARTTGSVFPGALEQVSLALPAGSDAMATYRARIVNPASMPTFRECREDNDTSADVTGSCVM